MKKELSMPVFAAIVVVVLVVAAGAGFWFLHRKKPLPSGQQALMDQYKKGQFPNPNGGAGTTAPTPQ